jgi:hypothetical protein
MSDPNAVMQGWETPNLAGNEAAHFAAAEAERLMEETQRQTPPAFAVGHDLARYARIGRFMQTQGAAIEAQAVAGMRAAGASWADVGGVLGISKQAAQQRYGR